MTVDLADQSRQLFKGTRHVGYFWKKRREAELQRKFDQVMQAQKEVMTLYEQARPVSLADELNAVAASF